MSTAARAAGAFEIQSRDSATTEANKRISLKSTHRLKSSVQASSVSPVTRWPGLAEPQP